VITVIINIWHCGPAVASYGLLGHVSKGIRCNPTVTFEQGV
jgi:hypothetical protein